VPLPPSLSVECGESLGEDWERGRWEREEEVPVDVEEDDFAPIVNLEEF